jgi:hypothetical protein
MEPLEPGIYDGLVVDAEELPDGAVSLEVAITSGPHKGVTVRIRGPRARHDALEVLGLPVTLNVTDEGIGLRIDRA